MNLCVQRQLTVAIENQPGRLAAIARVLADQGINIRDLSVVDNVEQGVIRLVTSDAVLCKEVLSRAGFYVFEAEVLLMDLPDTPGTLSRLCQALADAGINIDYAYGSEDPGGTRMRMVMKVSNVARATEVIQGLGEQ